MKAAVISWSGGKDSCYALQQCQRLDVKPVVLLSVMDKSGAFTKSNGVPKAILEQQASAINLPIVFFSTTWEEYEKDLVNALSLVSKKYSAEVCVFGDVDIESHRKFDEDVCVKSNLKAILPLWGKEREILAYEIVNSGIKAKISVIRESILSDNFLGVDYCESTILKLRKLNVDLCGESGEFHTLVYDSPLFSKPISVVPCEIYKIENCKLCNFQIRMDRLTSGMVSEINGNSIRKGSKLCCLLS